MNGRQIALSVVLAGFLALSGAAIYQHGYFGFFERMLASSATVLAGVDLVIALVLIVIWMWRDAAERGMSPWPYLVVTLLLGSAGPLLYLIWREGRSATPGRVAPQH